MRGRHTSATLKRIGLQDDLMVTQAEDIAPRALHYFQNVAAKAALESRIKASAGLLFNDDSVITAIDCFLREHGAAS